MSGCAGGTAPHGLSIVSRCLLFPQGGTTTGPVPSGGGTERAGLITSRLSPERCSVLRRLRIPYTGVLVGDRLPGDSRCNGHVWQGGGGCRTDNEVVRNGPTRVVFPSFWIRETNRQHITNSSIDRALLSHPVERCFVYGEGICVSAIAEEAEAPLSTSCRPDVRTGFEDHIRLRRRTSSSSPLSKSIWNCVRVAVTKLCLASACAFSSRSLSPAI